MYEKCTLNCRKCKIIWAFTQMSKVKMITLGNCYTQLLVVYTQMRMVFAQVKGILLYTVNTNESVCSSGDSVHSTKESVCSSGDIVHSTKESVCSAGDIVNSTEESECSVGT